LIFSFDEFILFMDKDKSHVTERLVFVFFPHLNLLMCGFEQNRSYFTRACLKSSNKGDSQGRMGIEVASGRRQIAVFFLGDQETNDQVVEASHYACGVCVYDTSVIFVKGDVPAIM
jgi:hypothetical protein